MGRLENEINIIPGIADARPTSFFFVRVPFTNIILCQFFKI
jgi:hypothetical protein